MSPFTDVWQYDSVNMFEPALCKCAIGFFKELKSVFWYILIMSAIRQKYVKKASDSDALFEIQSIFPIDASCSRDVSKIDL